MKHWCAVAGLGLAVLGFGAFGQEAAPDAEEPGVALVQSTIVSIDRREGGELIFQLTNGQVWVQAKLGYMTVNPGERVTIAPARLGGFILTTERSAATLVRRSHSQ